MMLFKRVFSVVLVCIILLYFLPLIVEGLKPETARVRITEHGISTVKVMGHTMAYREAGSGYPVILVHGFSQSTLSWEKTMPALAAAGYHAYAIDLFGHGMSDKPYGVKYSPESYAQQVYEFMRAVRVPKANIVAHSMGGAVAMKFACDHPDMAHKMALIGSAGLPGQLKSSTLLGALKYPLIGEFLILFDFKPVIRKAHEDINVNGRIPVTDDYVRAFARASWTRGYDYTFLRLLRNFNAPEWDLAECMRSITKPVLILHGADDRLIEPEAARIMRGMLRNSRLVIIKKGPHALMETDAPAVNRNITDFFGE